VKRGLLIVLISLAPLSIATASGGERDWTIEHPMLAGFLNGITIGACGQCQLGAAGRAAGTHDPFGMSPLVKSELSRLALRPYRIGQALGIGYAVIVIGGVFFRRLNRLKVTRKLELTA
jgi:hypothetical protein